MKHTNTIKELAEKVKDFGGRVLLVGGCVRDEILQKPVKDIDCEVYGLTTEQLETVLETFGEVNKVGASFSVYKLGQDIDVSLPRRDRKIGEGHKGFEVTADPEMSFEEACSRRDFTINAMMKDPLTGEIIDPFNGQADLESKLIRVVSPQSFQEDSLRVLRLVQFASRFEFEIEDETYELAKNTDLSDLPKERIWMELEKLFLKSANPALGVVDIYTLGIAKKCFPSFQMYDTMFDALQRTPQYCEKLTEGEKLAVIVTVMALGSEETLLDEMGLNSVDGYNVRKVAENLIRNIPERPLIGDYEYHLLSQRVIMKLMEALMYIFNVPEAKEFTETINRLGIQEKPVEPIVRGRDLIALGMEPSPAMGKALDQIYSLQIRGVPEEKLLSTAQTLYHIALGAQ